VTTHGFAIGLAVVVAVSAGGCKKQEEEAQRAPARTGDEATPTAPKTVPGAPHRTVRTDEPHPEDAEVRFDIAFCLDTTGSMSTLIETARDRIRSIAQFAGTGEPAPSVRFGVVAYRDVGEEYVTLTYGFSPDVVKAEQALGALRAEGGQDHPEHVVAGLRAAVEGLAWDPNAKLKFLFLIGDAPAHLDYGDDSAIEPILEKARAESIIIASIPLGEVGNDVKLFFHKVASATGGPSEGISAEAELESTVTSALAEHAAKVGVSYSSR
jgi:hypothetical protein